MLNSKTANLLDKLYNLRGNDSVILKEMDDEREKAINTKEETSKLADELSLKISNLEEEENVLASEGEKLKVALASIDGDSFALVLERLGIDFNAEKIKSEVEERLPYTIDKVVSEKEDAKNNLVKAEDEMNEAVTKIEELGIRKQEALSNQDRLNRYFELSLSSNINITREEITLLLSKFNFTEAEQREAAKILMFPEDGLFEYEKSINDTPVKDKSISQIIKDAKEDAEEVQAIHFEDKKEEKIEINESASEDVKFENISFEPVSFDKEEITFEDKKDITREDVINLLTNLDFDYLDFTGNSIDDIKDNYNEDLIRSNCRLVKDYNINKDIFVDNVVLLYDKDFEKKMNVLMGLGKDPKDIYLNSNILVRYDLDELNNAVQVLKDNGLEPRSIPLMAY